MSKTLGKGMNFSVKSYTILTCGNVGLSSSDVANDIRMTSTIILHLYVFCMVVDYVKRGGDWIC